MPNPFYCGKPSPEDRIWRTHISVHLNTTPLPIHTSPFLRKLSSPPFRLPPPPFRLSINIRRRPPPALQTFIHTQSNPRAPQRAHNHRRRSTHAPHPTTIVPSNIHRAILTNPPVLCPAQTYHRRRALYPTSPFHHSHSQRPSHLSPPLAQPPAPRSRLGLAFQLSHIVRFAR
jgi:hypothetical protein